MDLPRPACDSNVSLTLAAFGMPILTPDGHVAAMQDAEIQWRAFGDPRLAAYAASPLPAWLWTADGKRILWANPAGVRLFGAASAAALAEKTFGPADRHRRQIAWLAGRLLANGAIRLERLQGFGAAPGMLATCGACRFDFADGSHGVLIAAGNVPLIAPRPPQMQRDNGMQPAVASAEPVLSEPVLPDPVVLEPTPQPSAPLIEQPAPDYQRPAQSGEAPAEFALFDAFAEPAADDAPPATETIPPAAETVARAPTHAIDAFAGQPPARRLPLRFTWQMDREGRFTLGAGEFTGLIGPRTTAAFGRPWREIAETFGFDPTGRMMQRAVEAARAGEAPEYVLSRLQGWAAHEAISAALYILVRHPDSPEAAILEGANTPGDSDSIATLAGALVGARCGVSALPAGWVREVEWTDTLQALARAVVTGEPVAPLDGSGPVDAP